ncbi:MAG: hypothetical protein IT534_13615 [Bauldia sp.]|jgi:hypothetical protein|nr:hypothetical protein [Bauldia sp.]
MAKTFEQAVKAVRELPEEQQEAAGVVLLDHLATMQDFQLSDEQLGEVERRLADPSPQYLTLAEVRDRFRRGQA